MAKDKVATMILSDIGTTDLGVIPEGVLELAGRTQLRNVGKIVCVARKTRG